MPNRTSHALLVAAVAATTLVVGMGVGTASVPPTPTGDSVEDRVDVRSLMPPLSGPEPPLVPVKVAADFLSGEPLPAGATTYDSGAVGSPMRVAGGFLAHGRATSSGALSFVETKLDEDVTELGARLRFADEDSGSVALVVWRNSFVKAATSGAATPETGMRLVVTRGAWELSVVPDDVKVLASGTFADTSEAIVRLVRKGDDLYVVAPDGVVTRVRDAAASALAGPWASWGLTEVGPEQNPAAITSVWAG